MLQPTPPWVGIKRGGREGFGTGARLLPVVVTVSNQLWEIEGAVASMKFAVTWQHVKFATHIGMAHS